jgi:hypothetical protein
MELHKEAEAQAEEATWQDNVSPVDIHTSRRTRQETQPEAEEATWQEGEADEDTWQKGEGEDTDSKFYDSVWDGEDGDDDIFDATVDREVDDHNKFQDIVEQEDDAGLEHENLQLTREQEQHNRIQHIYAYSERIQCTYANSERIQILQSCYFSSTRIQGTQRAAGIDGRQRTASISPVFSNMRTTSE